MKKKSPLSEKTQAIIYGGLLGDGSLAVSRGYKNARYQFRHSIKQKEYFLWKAGELKEICGSKCIWRQGTEVQKDGWGSIKLRFGSKALPELTDITLVVGKGNQKTIRRRWLNRLTPLSLLVWWCDDGSLVSNTKHGVFCTDNFSEKEVNILKQYLNTVWKIKTSKFKVSGREHYRLAVRSRKDLKKFLRIILPYLRVESMLYKFLLLYRDPNLQQRWISEMAKLSIFSEETIKKTVSQRKETLKHFRK